MAPLKRTTLVAQKGCLPLAVAAPDSMRGATTQASARLAGFALAAVAVGGEHQLGGVHGGKRVLLLRGERLPRQHVSRRLEETREDIVVAVEPREKDFDVSSAQVEPPALGASIGGL